MALWSLVQKEKAFLWNFLVQKVWLSCAPDNWEHKLIEYDRLRSVVLNRTVAYSDRHFDDLFGSIAIIFKAFAYRQLIVFYSTGLHKKCTKNALYYCAQSANSFHWVLFVSSYTTTIVSITACLAHAPKKCPQSELQFDIKPPSDFKILSARKLKTLFQKYKLELTTGIHACIGHVLRKY